MKIVILNGSPKGQVSITMNYVRYIEKKFPDHEFVFLDIAQKIKKLEKDKTYFKEYFDTIAKADCILWAFPLYVCLVPSQYKRFIELIFERQQEFVFKGKYGAILTTSIHYFDHTAHNYIEGICNDLDMIFVETFSAEMNDLLNQEKRNQLEYFADDFFLASKEKRSMPKRFPALQTSEFKYQPDKLDEKIDTDKKIVVITDKNDPGTNLGKMIQQFVNCFNQKIEVVDMSDLKINGGCLGCIQCGYDNVCVYTGKDDFREFYQSTIPTADILIYAGTIKDRYLSALWKLYFDRRFFNNHSSFLDNPQVAFLISGPFSQLPNLQEILKADLEMTRANFAGYITDEPADSKTIDKQILSLSLNLKRHASKNYKKPVTFLGVGGLKIFRDDIYGKLRFPFVSDYKIYKRLGIFDFPQKKLKKRVINAIMILLCKLPGFRNEVYKKRMKTEMVTPFKKIISQTKISRE